MHSLFQHEEIDAVLLVDVSNTFNSLNQAAAQINIRVLCPALAKYAINTYPAPARLFGTGRKELISCDTVRLHVFTRRIPSFHLGLPSPPFANSLYPKVFSFPFYFTSSAVTAFFYVMRRVKTE